MWYWVYMAAVGGALAGLLFGGVCCRRWYQHGYRRGYRDAEDLALRYAARWMRRVDRPEAASVIEEHFR